MRVQTHAPRYHQIRFDTWFPNNEGYAISMTKRFVAVVAMLALFVVAAAPAAARTLPAQAPPPMQITSICLERSGAGVGGWKVECNRVHATVEFDGVTAHEAYFLTDHILLPGGTDYTLHLLGYTGIDPWQYPTNSTPVTLTGDGSVAVCIADNGTLRAPSDPDCVTAAVI